MNGRGIASLLAVAGVAFLLGWLVGQGTFSSAGASGETGESASLEAILAVPDTRERTRRLVDFFDRTDPSRAPELRSLLVDLESGAHVDETAEALFAAWWADADPIAAYDEAVHPRWKGRHPWMREVMRAWAQRDPVSAAAAVLELPPGAGRGRLDAARSVVDTWIALESMPDPTPLFLVLRELEPRARGGALQHVVASLVEKEGVDATLEFVRGLPRQSVMADARELTKELFARTAIVLLERDPALAVAWAAEHAAAPWGPGVQKHLAYYWGIRDGEAAMEWGLSLPDDLARPMILKRAWLSFGRKHTEEARAWLHARTPDEPLRRIYGDHLRTLAKTEPALALELADRTPDPDLRHEMLASAARGWIMKDPQAATAWLAEAGLPARLEDQVRQSARAGASRDRGDGA